MCLQIASSYDLADSDGRLTGGDAVRFFERSGLHRELLAKVCRVCLVPHLGVSPAPHRGGVFGISMRMTDLIACAPAGVELSRQQQARVSGCERLQ